MSILLHNKKMVEQWEEKDDHCAQACAPHKPHCEWGGKPNKLEDKEYKF